MVPLDSCVADTQGAIGYNLQMALDNEFHKVGLNPAVATVVTQVEVSEDDPSFQHPTKPIGSFFTKEDADYHAQPGNGTVLIQAVRLENLIEVDRVREEINPGVVKTDSSKAIKFLSVGLPVLVLDSQTETNQLREAFGKKVDISLVDMNIVFRLPSEELENKFVDESKAAGMVAFSLSANNIGGGSTTGLAGKAFGTWGLSAIWYVLAASVAMIPLAFFAPKIRRTLAITIPEVVERRFGKVSSTFTAVLNILALFCLTSSQIAASGAVITTLTGIPLNVCLLIAGLVVIGYTTMWELEDRGRWFILPGDPVYEGEVVGERNRDLDLNLNPTRTKHLTNLRASGHGYVAFLDMPFVSV